MTKDAIRPSEITATDRPSVDRMTAEQMRLSVLLRAEAPSPEEALRVERVTTADAFAALAPEWEALEATIHPRTPFTSPAWNQLWWKHNAADRFFVKDELFTHIVRDPTGALIAVAPMMRTSRPAAGPFKARMLQFFGTDPNVTEMRGLVCRPADQDEVMKALTRNFIDNRDDWDWIDWGGVRDTEDVTRWLKRSGAIGRDRRIPIFHLSMPATWEELKTGLSRNMKEALRKCYNSLKRAGHEFTFRVVSQPADVAAALETFFTLHASRGAVTDGVPHNNVFASDHDRAFIGEYAQLMAERNALRIFQLVIADKVVATRIGFLLGSELYLYYSGYDVDWGQFSVMTTVVAESIKWAIEQRLTTVNLSTGRDPSKLRWNPQEVVYTSAVQLSPTRRAKVVFRTYHDVLRLKRESQFGKLLGVVTR
jgi:CelD/BcsL family acetyltransferase involved in cellulose biosynthesis